MQDNHSISGEAIKAFPPISVTGLTMYGVTLSDWVLMATLVYTVLQVGILIRDKIWIPYTRKHKNGNKTPNES